MNKFTIKELEKFSGIKAHTIRIWEKRYHLLAPKRTQTNIRYYSDDDLRQILNVAFLNNRGLKISKIAALSQAEIHQKVLGYKESGDYDVYVNRCVSAGMEFDIQEFNACFKECVYKFGFEETVLNVLFPLLNNIGIMWGTKDLSPAHEHFISNLIRMKLMHAINEEEDVDTKKPLCLLFLHQNEGHDIALLFAWYLLRKNHYPVVNLGALVSEEALLLAYEKLNPEIALTFFTANIGEELRLQYLRTMKNRLEKARLFYGAEGVFNEMDAAGKNIKKGMMQDFLSVLSE